jgi:hypothetical protein
MALLPAALSLAHEGLLFDNSQRGEIAGLVLQAYFDGDRLELLADRPAVWARVLADLMVRRAEEKESMRSHAGMANASLQSARLDGASTEGRIAILGAHFMIQQDQRTSALVLHDRLLLLVGAIPAQGQNCRISYREGVGSVELLNPPLRGKRPVVPT